MRLSTRGCYGVRAMLELALNYGGKPVLMRTIADNQGISRKYLHALLTSLKAAGLVRSIRGSGGGYLLARAPSNIRVDEVVRVLEGSLSLTDCVEDASTCKRSSCCVTIDLWRELSAAIQNLLAGVTIQDLVTRQSEKASQALTYHI
jgi:Rrf2 family transcriptional regulator, iron-sulfur cluster assembly transcription factor